MLEINQQALIENKPESLRNLYDRHGGMLLGYIFGIVKDRKLAEEYLVQLFCDLSQHFNEIKWDGTSNWCLLQRFAKEKLSGFIHTARECEAPAGDDLIKHSHGNKYLEQLTDEQQLVFCDVYYHGKTIAAISIELNKTEDLIRKILKEAFAIIRRKGGEN